jgi:hypothetical protein
MLAPDCMLVPGLWGLVGLRMDGGSTCTPAPRLGLLARVADTTLH